MLTKEEIINRLMETVDHTVERLGSSYPLSNMEVLRYSTRRDVLLEVLEMNLDEVRAEAKKPQLINVLRGLYIMGMNFIAFDECGDVWAYEYPPEKDSFVFVATKGIMVKYVGDTLGVYRKGSFAEEAPIIIKNELDRLDRLAPKDK